MATVAKIVAELAADVRGWSTGLRQAAKDTEKFAADVKRSAGRAKIFELEDVQRQARDVAKTLTGGIRGGLATEQATIRESLFRGLTDRGGAESAGVAAAQRFNAGILQQIDRLAASGRLTGPLREALVEQLDAAGLDAGEKIGKSMKDGIDAADVPGKGRRMMAELGGALAAGGAILSAGITAPLVMGAKAALKAAAEAVESDNLFTVALGRYAAQGRAFSETMRDALGVSATDTRKNVATFDAMFKSLGLTEKGAYALATGLTSLAGDLSSFYNLSRDDAFTKLQSGITGEIEPLRRLGIIVDEATVKQTAYALGIAKTGTQLTEGQKVLGRYAAIMRQSAIAQGDLARTRNSPLNVLRELQTTVGDLSREVGAVLLPALSGFATMARDLLASGRDMVRAFAGLPKPVQETAIAFAALLAIAGPLALALGGIMLAVAIIGAPVLGTVAAVAALVAVLIGFRKEIADAAVSVWAIIGGPLTAFARFVETVLVVVIGGAVGVIVQGFVKLYDAVSGTLSAVAREFMATFGPLIRFVVEWGRKIVGAVVDAFVAIGRYIAQSRLGQAVVLIFQSIVDGLGALAGQFLAVGKRLVNAIIQGVADAARRIPGVGDAVAKHVESLLIGAGQTRVAAAAGAAVAKNYTEGVRKGVAAAKAVVPALPKVDVSMIDPNGLGAIATGSGKAKSALEQYAAKVNDVAEAFKSIQDAQVGTRENDRAALATYTAALAVVQQIPQNMTEGATALRKAVVELGDALRDAVPDDFKPKITFTLRSESLEAAVTRAARVGLADPGVEERFRQVAVNGFVRGLTEAARLAPFKLPNIAPTIQATVSTSGLLGSANAVAATLANLADDARSAGRAMKNVPVIGPALARATTKLASGLDTAATAVVRFGSAFRSPAAAASTALGLLGNAALGATRGLGAVVVGLGRSIVAALNPLNVFATLAERVGGALQPVFDALGPSLEKLAQVVSEGLAPVFEALAPVIDAFLPLLRALMQILGPILTALAPVLSAFVPILNALLPLVKAAAIAFTYLAQIVLSVGAGLLRLAGNLIIGFGVVIETIARAVDKLPGVSAKGAIRFAEGIQDVGRGFLRTADELRDASNAMGRARDEIRGVSLSAVGDSADAAAIGLSGVASTARDVAEELRNIPQGFRVADARFRATLPSQSRVPQIGGTTPNGEPTTGSDGQVPFGGPVLSLAGATINVTADSESTIRTVMADVYKGAERIAAQNTGNSRNAPSFVLQSIRSYSV